MWGPHTTPLLGTGDESCHRKGDQRIRVERQVVVRSPRTPATQPVPTGRAVLGFPLFLITGRLGPGIICKHYFARIV